MHPEFSETQFAFGIIHEFLLKHPNSILFAPTQYQEKNCGFDVALRSSRGIPIFYQFKVSECLATLGKEYIHFNEKYYRFYTYYCNPEDNQHNILKKLSLAFSKVFYVAPCFHSFKEFNTYLKATAITNHSKFIRLKKLKEITNNSRHAICYTASGKVGMFSEPVIDNDGAISVDSLLNEQDCDSNLNLDSCVSVLSEIIDMDFKTNDMELENKLFEIGKKLFSYGLFFIWFPVK